MKRNELDFTGRIKSMAKVAVVSGGSRGIGAAVCRTLAGEGYTVIIDYRINREAAESLEAELRASGMNAEAYCCDVSDEASVVELFSYVIKKYGRVDVLVNNAGVSNYELFTDISSDSWDYIMNTNLKGTFFMSREALGNMISNKRGRIINIASMWGICGASCEVAYSVSKSGVIGLTKALAKEVGPSGITVNCVAPGVIQTDMLKDISDEAVEMLKEETPLGILGTPENVADCVAFLASDKAGFITGQVLSPNGGMVI